MTTAKSRLTLGGLFFLVLGLTLLALAIGDSSFNLTYLFDLLLGTANQKTLLIMTKIRLPRILAALLAGGSLAISGLLLQTLTRNPLADSGVLGINTGAGMVIALMLAYDQLNSHLMVMTLPVLAMLGSCLTILVVYLISRKANHGISPVRLIITGVGISTMLSGAMVSVVGNINRYKVDYMVAWLSGRISGDDWLTITILAPLLIGLWILAYSRSQALNIMNLNDETALALGLNLQRERLISLILATSLSALSVILVGNITFIGLVAGHITRRLLGNQHQTSLPACLLIGMLILLIADTIGRVFLVGTGIPTGLLVSVLGAPYFLYLMTKVGK